MTAETAGKIRTNLRIFRYALAAIHTVIGILSFLNPDMVDVIPSLRQFGLLADTQTWGTAALFIGIGLFLIPRASFALVIWQGLSASLFFIFTYLIASGPFGFLTWGAGTYGVLACCSLTVMIYTASQMFDNLDLATPVQSAQAWVHQRRAKKAH